MTVTIAQKVFNATQVVEYSDEKKGDILQLNLKETTLREVRDLLSVSSGRISVQRDNASQPIVFTNYTKVSDITRSITDFDDLIVVELQAVYETTVKNVN